MAAPPRGFRDILPTEARELRAIERALTESFSAHGYMPLEPPMVEQSAGDSIIAGDRSMRFLDRDGSLIALRPDITSAVARLVAQRYADTTGDLRLSYFGPVFREEPAMLGAEREYDQAGVELVGPSGALADAEALALLAESLAAAGLRGGTIEAHLDTSSGQPALELGLLPTADVSLSMEYAIARAAFVSQDQAAVMAAFMSGKVKVEGDMAKLLAMQAQQSQAGPLAAEVLARVKDITVE